MLFNGSELERLERQYEYARLRYVLTYGFIFYQYLEYAGDSRPILILDLAIRNLNALFL